MAEIKTLIRSGLPGVRTYLAVLLVTTGLYLLGQVFLPGNVFTIRLPIYLVAMAVAGFAFWIQVFVGSWARQLQQLRTAVSSRKLPKPHGWLIIATSVGFVLVFSQSRETLSLVVLHFAIGSSLVWVYQALMWMMGLQQG